MLKKKLFARTLSSPTLSDPALQILPPLCKRLLLLGVSLFISVTSHADAIPLQEWDLASIDLHFSRTDEPTDNPTHWVCFRADIEENLQQPLWLGFGSAPGRALRASQQPLNRDGAWYFKESEKGCQPSDSYFNGLGINLIDLESGQIEIYLTHFAPIDPTGDFAFNENYRRQGLIHPPHFESTHQLLLEGSCAIIKPKFPMNFWKPEALQCDFGDQGSITWTHR